MQYSYITFFRIIWTLSPTTDYQGADKSTQVTHRKQLQMPPMVKNKFIFPISDEEFYDMLTIFPVIYDTCRSSHLILNFPVELQFVNKSKFAAKRSTCKLSIYMNS